MFTALQACFLIGWMFSATTRQIFHRRLQRPMYLEVGADAYLLPPTVRQACAQAIDGVRGRVCLSRARHVPRHVRRHATECLGGCAYHVPGMCMRRSAWAGVLATCQRRYLSRARHVRRHATECVGGCAYHVPGMCAGMRRSAWAGVHLMCQPGAQACK